jgi:membrane associated rhomboid family serine protease
MFPLKDNIPTLRFPLVTVVLIAINVVVFLYGLRHPPVHLRTAVGNVPVAVTGSDEVTAEWGFIPCRLVGSCPQASVQLLPLADEPGYGARVHVPPHVAFLTLITAMFIHGGWLHIAGNMLFLWIFGNNVEDSMGRLRFIVFYLLCGILAGLAQLATDPSSTVPNIGASGAIAGVLGAYILLYPRARVLTAIFLIVYFTIIEVPAYAVLAAWFALQVVAGLGSTGAQGGVAYFAHIGGFVAGLVLIRAFARRRSPPMLAGP